MIYFNLAFLIVSTALVITVESPVGKFVNILAVILNFAAVSAHLMNYTC